MYSRARRGRSIEIETMENNRIDRLRRFKDNLPDIWYAYTAKYLYVYENHSIMDYDIRHRISLSSSNDLANKVIKEISDGTFRTPEAFDTWFDSLQPRTRRHNSSLNDTKHGRKAVGSGEISQNSSPQSSGSAGSVQGNSNNSRVKNKFSMEAPVEQKENLIALHNLDETKLLKKISKRSMEPESDRYIVALDDANIDELKKSLTLDEAIDLLDAQTGLSYRLRSSDNPMSRAGYAMFADNIDSLIGAYGGSRPKAFSVEISALTPISDIMQDILDARHEADEKWPWILEDHEHLSDDEFAALFDPEDIVISAAAYDDEALVEWLCDNVLIPKDIIGVKTSDGAIAFDTGIIKRNLPAEVTSTQFSSDEAIPRSKRFDSKNEDIRYSREQSKGKEYSGKNVEWAVKNGIITKEERISFFHKIADIKKLGHKYRQAKNGDYIVDLGEKLLFTDADWYSPSLNMVVSFNDSFESSMFYAKEIVFNEAKTEADYNRARQAIETAYWQGYVEFSYSRNYQTNVGKNAGRERENSQRNNGESVKFSMETPVEQKENLIALHNLDETKLLKTLKLGGFPMPSMDYIFANDSLFVINNHDEASFTVTRKIDPAKDKVLADKIVEALKNGSIETTRDFDRWAKVLRNNARRGNGDNVHAGNRRAAGGNAQLDDRAERTADRGSIADKSSGDNGVSYSREPETLNELRRREDSFSDGVFSAFSSRHPHQGCFLAYTGKTVIDQLAQFRTKNMNKS